MIDQHYWDEAKAMILASGWGENRSEEWHQGLLNAVAWHLAGMPLGFGRSACPYEIKTAQRDAWLGGWMNGKAACIREGIGDAEMYQ
jgi:ribosome modulation factor